VRIWLQGRVAQPFDQADHALGHASAAMTALYTGEIPLEHVQAEFSSKIGNQIVVLENMENEAFA